VSNLIDIGTRNAEGYCRKCGAPMDISGQCVLCSVNENQRKSEPGMSISEFMERELSDPDLHVNMSVELAFDQLHDHLMTHHHSYPGGETGRKFCIIILRALRAEVERLANEREGEG